MQNPSTHNYWSLIWLRFKKNRGAKWSFSLFILLIWIAMLQPFIAGDIPIYAEIDGKSSFPILKKYLIDFGLATPTDAYRNGGYWHKQKYDAVIFPIIPYSATYRDTRNIHYKSPFGPQNIRRGQTWHYLGTDHLGRDVASGMIAGVRIALKVGLFSMLIATLIGIALGALAGFYGDDKLQMSLGAVLLNLLAIFLSVFYGFIARSYAFAEGNMAWEMLKSMGIVASIFLLLNLLSSLLHAIPLLGKKVTIPIDIVVMRLVEVMNSIPSLLIIIAFAAIFSSRSIWPLIFIIGLVRWTSIAKFTRAELLKIRNLEYIQSAKALGFNNRQILFYHALPNAIGPALIVIAFGIAGAVLAEATLAFLDIGTDELNRISWGTLLKGARNNAAYWWMAIFPGLAIFVTVMIFNLMGEGLKDALDAKDI